MHHLDELLEHLLGDGEIGNDAIFHGPDRLDVAGHLAQHRLGFLADGLDRFFALWAAFVANRDHGRFIEHNTLVAHENQGVGSTQVNRQISGEILTEGLKH